MRTETVIQTPSNVILPVDDDEMAGIDEGDFVCTPDKATMTRSADSFSMSTGNDSPEITSTQSQSAPNAPRKKISGKEYSADDIRMSQGLLVTQSTQGIGSQIYRDIERELIELSATKCFMCGEEQCNGFKNRGEEMCRKRTQLVRSISRMICFGCGGAHERAKCVFRPSREPPSVPAGIERCFFCYLSQRAAFGVSFHSGDSQLSGTQESKRSCRTRGDHIFAMLSAFYHAKSSFIDSFKETCGEQLSSMPPIDPSPTTIFQRYWNWLWNDCPSRNGILHLDVVLRFMINAMYNPYWDL